MLVRLESTSFWPTLASKRRRTSGRWVSRWSSRLPTWPRMILSCSPRSWPRTVASRGRRLQFVSGQWRWTLLRWTQLMTCWRRATPTPLCSLSTWLPMDWTATDLRYHYKFDNSVVRASDLWSTTGCEFDYSRPCAAGLVLGWVTVCGPVNHLGV